MTKYRLRCYNGTDEATIDFDSDSMMKKITDAMEAAGFNVLPFVKDKPTRSYVPYVGEEE